MTINRFNSVDFQLGGFSTWWIFNLVDFQLGGFSTWWIFNLVDFQLGVILVKFTHGPRLGSDFSVTPTPLPRYTHLCATLYSPLPLYAPLGLEKNTRVLGTTNAP
jgi:hypothetical protein